MWHEDDKMEAWPAGVKTGLIPWELPFHFFFIDVRI